MTGPDADLWPANSDGNKSWDWQSNSPCAEAEALTARGADDDTLLAAVGRYTVENLVLNAVHEIGEWFRFDGERIFPAHTSGIRPSSERDPQGNGVVALQVEFGEARAPQGAPAHRGADDLCGQRLVKCLNKSAMASRFTYVPGSTISYEAGGPVIQLRPAGEPVRVWRSVWSKSTLEAAGVDAVEMVDSARRDVHRALVTMEAERICQAFHVDGQRPWRLGCAKPPVGPDDHDSEVAGSDLVSLSLRYLASVEHSKGRGDNGLRSSLGAVKLSGVL